MTLRRSGGLGRGKAGTPATRPPDPEKPRARAARRALRLLDRAREDAGVAGSATLSDWEREFVDGVGDRIRRYGSAFRDRAKGAPDAALSTLQGRKVREIAAKLRQKDDGPGDGPEEGGGGDGGARPPVQQRGGKWKRSTGS